MKMDIFGRSPGTPGTPSRGSIQVEFFYPGIVFLEILDFQFLHVIPRYFNNFVIDLFVCKFALVSVY